MSTKFAWLFLLLLPPNLAGVAGAQPITIPLVTVGDPGNAADQLTGLGAVSYSYDIAEFDVTTSEYAAFLNAVATTGDPYGLYNSSMASESITYGITQSSSSGVYSFSVKGSGNVPVTYVSWNVGNTEWKYMEWRRS